MAEQTGVRRGQDDHKAFIRPETYLIAANIAEADVCCMIDKEGTVLASRMQCGRAYPQPTAVRILHGMATMTANANEPPGGCFDVSLGKDVSRT